MTAMIENASLALLATLLMAVGTAEFSCAADDLPVSSKPAAENSKRNMKAMKLVFLNASKNREGNTASLAAATLKGLDYKTINLIDYHIDQIGQETKSDQYRRVINEIAGADVIVIGTPVYWSDMTGYLKTFIDRLNDIVDDDLKSDKAPLNGADIYLIVQGSEPSDAIPGITTVIKHICRRFFMNYQGIILSKSDAEKFNKALSVD